VTARQGLVVVEAMKMENELRAPKDGRVADIRVKEGMSVDANAVLTRTMRELNCILMYSVSGSPFTRRRAESSARVVTCAVILAVAFVTSITVDLGPSLRAQAEKQGSNLLKRTIHIGRLGVHSCVASTSSRTRHRGLTPQSRPRS
jgi:hypothetical protein